MTKEHSNFRIADKPGTGSAIGHKGVGDKENAILYLQRGSGQTDANLIWLRVEPVFDEIRSDPRFKGLLRRQGTSAH